uniref:GNAT family N-acetyltransferase n=1 Tax=Flavobacterium sp. TaxID=239 RepID=UPI0037C16F17
MTLKGQNIHLRALEPEDLDFLYEIENNKSIWEVSNTQTPYSKWVLKQYLENAHLDIYEAKQLRLVIVFSETNEKVGFIDLFDFDAKNSRAGIGILISENFRNQGIGKETLQLLSNYAFT